jgi:hypothetical protein
MTRLPEWLEKLRAASERAAAQRTVAGSVAYAVLFLAAALLWARMPSTRPVARHVFTAVLLGLAINDFARGLRKLGRDRGLPAWTWIVATVAYGAAAVAAVIAVVLLGA